ncbi:oxidoreductase [Anaeromyxobacter oryzae]|uniref:Short-chain dehydrogenase/reductase n=1 Tax=Anaeromyxobacter oryzae TaxID=2918170 RepID=A0ABN6MWT8_9BACT|nr:oxidoreductase [Anaeromyxobacter oryzae]BDG04188.1 short-chain dehydrogenase/reductase [Anaeromyxobacter oryzae]
MTRKVALVTGASSGIGTEVALALLDRGYGAYGAARRVDRMAQIAERGGVALPLDLTDERSIEACVSTVLEKEGRLDVLVNNAGYGSYGAIEDVPLAEARRQFEVNLFGLARMTQLVLPAMRKQGRGHVFNVSSIGGKVFTPMGGWYHATKHALEGWSDVLRMEVEPFGIHVVIIEPGAIATEWGGIARDSLLATSGEGAYRELARGVANGLKPSGIPGSPPRVVADTVVRALAARRPRTRYAVGAGARPILLARALLPDRAYDGVLRRVMRMLPS